MSSAAVDFRFRMRCTSFLRADIAGAIAVDVLAGPNSTVDAAQRLAPPLSEALSIALALHVQQNNISKVSFKSSLLPQPQA